MKITCTCIAHPRVNEGERERQLEIFNPKQKHTNKNKIKTNHLKQPLSSLKHDIFNESLYGL